MDHKNKLKQISATLDLACPKPRIARTRIDALTQAKEPLQDLHIPTSKTSSITYINTSNIIAVTQSRKVEVYSLEDGVEKIQTFDKHGGDVKEVKVIHLSHEILVSVDDKGNLFSWNAKTGQVIGQFKKNDAFHYVEKLDDDYLLVGATHGNLYVLSHSMGDNFVEARCLLASPFSHHNATIVSICVRGNTQY